MASIHPNSRNHKTKIRKASNHLKNSKFRADLYRDNTGSINWSKNVSAWHEGIKALQVGAA